ALGRNHIASSPIIGHRNAFQIPCVRASSKLAVECRPKRSVHENGQPRTSGSARAGLSASSASDSNTLDQPNNRWQVNKSSTQLKPSIHCTLETSARSAQPLEPILGSEVTDPFCRLPLTLHYSIGQRLFTLGDLLRDISTDPSTRFYQGVASDFHVPTRSGSRTTGEKVG
ncbi:conserved hypothetical protein, partial [Trichinella spiralis]|uniref:hypothetical protein n=1 Tax=Trichinella spiralis TaxID=6334 RepID=UPI0001EFEA27